jgi:glutaredoxin
VIVVYGKTTCAYCDRAKDLLDEKGIPYEFKNIEEEWQALEEMRILTGGARTVPQILVDKKPIGDYDGLRAWVKTLP